MKKISLGKQHTIIHASVGEHEKVLFVSCDYILSLRLGQQTWNMSPPLRKYLFFEVKQKTAAVSMWCNVMKIHVAKFVKSTKRKKSHK